ncbi:hypothetical protein PoB_001938800 [Plakobranchus ocellatus]|uniref:Uncharacterized protein n=1 Tax=Plakobranchus ocellatus TaxID=259542 RepID=A0AAV3ZDR2_9GAST|nr:hypothetical protein PoB_001938800 [Plakobranchus ocellatus]
MPCRAKKHEEKLCTNSNRPNELEIEADDVETSSSSCHKTLRNTNKNVTLSGRKSEKYPGTYVSPNTAPSKKLKRPDSCDQVEESMKEGHSKTPKASENMRKSVTGSHDWSSWNNNHSRSGMLHDSSTQEEQQMAALRRLNYLNRKLKSQKSVASYSPIFQNEECPDLVLEPDPPSWSYESYSESESRDCALSGLRSYIRANEEQLDSFEQGNQIEEDPVGCPPPEPLVSYLDGVITPRFTVHKCSMNQADNDDCEDGFMGDQSCSGNQDHKRKSSTTRMERQHSKKGSRPRSLSVERFRRLEIGICKLSSEDEVFQEQKVIFDKAKRNVRREQKSSPCEDEEEIQDKSPTMHQGIEAIPSASSTTMTELSPLPRGRTKNRSSDSSYKMTKKEHSPSRDGRKDIPASDITPIVIRNEDLLSMPTQERTGSVKGIEKLTMQTGQIVSPMLQSQQAPFAVGHSYLKPDFENIDSSDTIADANVPNARAQRRLVVQKNNSSVRIWSNSKMVSKSGKQPNLRLYPFYEDGIVEDEDDEEEDSSADDKSEGDVHQEGQGEIDEDNEYEDLIIQTELSKGSKVRVLNSQGTIADIEHDDAQSPEGRHFQIMKYKPDTGEIDILKEHIFAKARQDTENTSQNNEACHKTDTVSTPRSMAQTTNEEQASINKRKQRSPKMQNVDTKRTSPKSKKEKSTMSSPPMNKTSICRRKPPLHAVNGKRTSPTNSPPKPIALPSKTKRQRELSGATKEKGDGPKASSPFNTQRQGSSDQDEKEIPMCNNGNTRVVLVLRTPPRKSVSPDKLSLLKNTPSPANDKQLLDKAKPSPSKNTKAPGFDDAGVKLSLEKNRKESSRYKFDSVMPKICGNESDELCYPDDAEKSKNEEITTFLIESRPNILLDDTKLFSKASVDTQEGDVDGNSEDETSNDLQTVEDPIKTRGQCKFSRYQPCRHDGNVPQANVASNATKSEKPFISQKKILKKLSDEVKKRKESIVDHSPCVFDRVHPCNHEIHSPCQFDRYRPCQHEECDLPVPQTVRETNEVTASVKKKPNLMVRPGDYKYGSKTLQDKLGQHSPCLFDRYKPCLHEECVEPTGTAVKDRQGVNMLSLASKISHRHDAKAKHKETSLDPFRCKFNRYTPCFHEDDIKINRALGKKASLRPEKTKARHAETIEQMSQEPVKSCKFDRFRPCFAHASNEQTNAEETQSEDENNTEISTNVKPFKRPVGDKKALTMDKGIFITNEKSEGIGDSLSKIGSVSDKRTASSLSGNEKEKSEKRGARELTQPMADGPNIKTRASSSTAVEIHEGGGDGDVPKLGDGAMKDKDDEPEQAGAMSFMARISRAWFSSAQAQVARLAPQPHSIVHPGLGYVPALESCIGVSPKQTGAKLDDSSNTLKKREQRQSQKYLTSCQIPRKDKFDIDASKPEKRRVEVRNDTSSSEYKRDYFKQGIYELSLTESKTGGESSVVDTSLVTEVADPSGWTLTPTRAGWQQPNKNGRHRLKVTKACSGKPDTVEHPRLSQQIWTGDGTIPEDFLILMSNLYPTLPESGDSGDTFKASKVVDSAVEIVSADPLSRHFSDVARANRPTEGGREQLLKENHQKSYRGQPGLTLCHRSQLPRCCVGDDDSPGEENTANLFKEDRHLINVGQFFDKHEDSFSSQTDYKRYGGGEGGANRNNTDIDLIIREDEKVNSSSRLTHRMLSRSNQSNASDYGSGTETANKHSKMCGKEIYHDLINTEKSEEETKNVNNLPIGQAAIPEGNSGAHLSSKETQAMVVAAAELVSYKSLLDAISKIAHMEPHDSPTIDDNEPKKPPARDKVVDGQDKSSLCSPDCDCESSPSNTASDKKSESVFEESDTDTCSDTSYDSDSVSSKGDSKTQNHEKENVHSNYGIPSSDECFTGGQNIAKENESFHHKDRKYGTERERKTCEDRQDVIQSTNNNPQKVPILGRGFKEETVGYKKAYGDTKTTTQNRGNCSSDVSKAAGGEFETEKEKERNVTDGQFSKGCLDVDKRNRKKDEALVETKGVEEKELNDFDDSETESSEEYEEPTSDEDTNETGSAEDTEEDDEEEEDDEQQEREEFIHEEQEMFL